MSSVQEKIIPLARIVRTHGFPKLGVCTFKADLFSAGGTLFRDKKNLFVSAHPVSPPFNSPVEWLPLEVCEKITPHGGAFGNAKAILLKLKRAETELRGHLIGLAREDFPELKKGFYLFDLINKQIANDRGEVVGIVIGFEDNGSTAVEAVNLKVRSLTGFEFSFPAQWIAEAELTRAIRSDNSPINVVNVEEWMIDPRTPNDEHGDAE